VLILPKTFIQPKYEDCRTAHAHTPPTEAARATVVPVRSLLACRDEWSSPVTPYIALLHTTPWPQGFLCLSSHSSDPEGNFRGNQLRGRSMSLSPLSPRSDKRFARQYGGWRSPQFPMASPSQGIVHRLSGPAISMHTLRTLSTRRGPGDHCGPGGFSEENSPRPSWWGTFWEQCPRTNSLCFHHAFGMEGLGENPPRSFGIDIRLA